MTTTQFGNKRAAYLQLYKCEKHKYYFKVPKLAILPRYVKAEHKSFQSHNQPTVSLTSYQKAYSLVQLSDSLLFHYLIPM